MDDGCLMYLLADHLGGTTHVLDSSGVLLSEQKYWPYGSVRSGGIGQTDVQYTGQRSEPGDSALGLYNYRARFYSTTLGRFVSADTVVQSKAFPQSLNRYAYALGNPIRFNDPTGHCVGGLDCSPTIALNLLACAASYDGCALVHSAMGWRTWTSDQVLAAHRFASAALETLEFWENFARADINPYRNAVTGYRDAPLMKASSYVTSVFSYANLAINERLPSLTSRLAGKLTELLTDDYLLATGVVVGAGILVGATCGGTIATGGALTPGCAASIIVFGAAEAYRIKVDAVAVSNGDKDLLVALVDHTGAVALLPWTTGASLGARIAIFAAAQIVRQVVGHIDDLTEPIR